MFPITAFNPQDPIVTIGDYTSEFSSKKDDRAEGVIDLRKRMGLTLVKD